MGCLLAVSLLSEKKKKKSEYYGAWRKLRNRPHMGGKYYGAWRELTPTYGVKGRGIIPVPSRFLDFLHLVYKTYG